MRLNCYFADSSDPFIQMIRECDSGNLHTRSSAWLVALMHSCKGVLLLPTSRRAYTGMHPSRLNVASSKCLKQMRDITGRVAVCVRSWRGKPMHEQYRRLTEQPPVNMKGTYGWSECFCCNCGTDCCFSRPSSSDSVL